MTVPYAAPRRPLTGTLAAMIVATVLMLLAGALSQAGTARAQATIAGPDRPAASTLVVGSKRFTESYILGEIMRRTAESAGEARVRHEQGLGNTGIVHAALASGAIDLYVEYTGTLAREILRLDDPDDATALAGALRQRGFAISRPLGFNNTYALAMQRAQAARLGIHRISDLAGHPALRLGLTQEFIGRADGWPGLRGRYDLPFGTPRGVEHGLKFGALAAGQLDVIDVYSTDAAIERHGLQVLRDDRNWFPRYDAVLLYRAGLEHRLPRTYAALMALEGRLDDATMRALNARAEVGGETFAGIAAGFVAGPLQQSAGAQPAAAGEAAPAAAPSGMARRTLSDAVFDPAHRRAPRARVWLAAVVDPGRHSARHLVRRQRLGTPLGAAGRRPRADHPVAGPAGLPDHAVFTHRHAAGADRALPLRTAADRAQHLRRPRSHPAVAARLGPGIGTAAHGAAAAHRTAAGARGDPRRHTDLGGDQRRHRHHRSLHRRRWLW
jgi:glycine betaine/choline ABC-type transport system substrate-binding protein